MHMKTDAAAAENFQMSAGTAMARWIASSIGAGPTRQMAARNSKNLQEADDTGAASSTGAVPTRQMTSRDSKDLQCSQEAEDTDAGPSTPPALLRNHRAEWLRNHRADLAKMKSSLEQFADEQIKRRRLMQLQFAKDLIANRALGQAATDLVARIADHAASIERLSTDGELEDLTETKRKGLGLELKFLELDCQQIMKEQIAGELALHNAAELAVQHAAERAKARKFDRQLAKEPIACEPASQTAATEQQVMTEQVAGEPALQTTTE